MKLDYGCPECGQLLFKSEQPGLAVELECPRDGIVTAVWRGHIVHYRCSKCGREQYCERPKAGRKYCVVCGTNTLVIQRPVEAPAHRMSG